MNNRFEVPPEMAHEIAFKRLVLERLKIAGQQRVGAHTLHSVEISTWQDHVSDSLVIQLVSEVLAERALDTEVRRDWAGNGKATVHVRMRGLILPFALAAAVCFAGIIAGSFEVVLASGAIAMLAVVMLSLNPGQDVDVTVPVGGEIVVPATYWRKFPEAETVYPKTLGRPVEFAVMGPPRFEADDHV